MLKLGCVMLVFLATASGFTQDGDFKGKVVIAGTGPQLERQLTSSPQRSTSGESRIGS